MKNQSMHNKGIELKIARDQVGFEALEETKPKNTDLVVWGSNLSSTAGTGRNTRIVKNMIVLPLYQKSVVVGLLLSDGNLSSTRSQDNPHLAFKQGLNNSKYVLFVYSILSHYCNVYPSLVKSIRKDRTHFALYFRTRGLPCFSELRSLFYTDKKKEFLKIYIIF